MCARWDLVVADFATEYQRHLLTEHKDMSWREFEFYLTGLLAADTRLYRHFAAQGDD